MTKKTVWLAGVCVASLIGHALAGPIKQFHHVGTVGRPADGDNREELGRPAYINRTLDPATTRVLQSANAAWLMGVLPDRFETTAEAKSWLAKASPMDRALVAASAQCRPERLAGSPAYRVA